MTQPETRSLHRKLAQVMYEAERIPKNGRAPKEMGGYDFVQVGDAADFIRKALAEKVVTMMPTNVSVVGQHEGTTKGGAHVMTVDIVMDWTITDGESGESITIQSFGAASDMGDKYSGKASTSAMKYALLTGFLLSTGEDTELGDTPNRQPQRPVGEHDAPPPRPQLVRRADGLIGKVEKGKPPCDLELRETPDGWVWGFKLAAAGKGYQALASGELAEALSQASEGLLGASVTVWGHIDMVPWTRKVNGVETDMPPFARIAVERVQGPDWTLPAEPPAPSEAESAELEGLVW